MQNVVKGWFSGSSSGGGIPEQQKPGSVLADWNSYSASQEGTASDVEAVSLLKSANETIKGAFNTVSRNVRELPGNVQTAASSLPSRKAITYFGVMLGAGMFFIFIAFLLFLPVIVLMPHKFASCFTIGSLLVIGSFFVLKGPRTQFFHMISKERLPFTAAFIGSMAGTIYASMVMHSYVLSVIFSVIQVLALLYYVVSYFPGGSAGLQFLTAMIKSWVMKCFGR
ncbi:hypothetical protein O6H91_07G012000 [Diphasiastrum complanatum]|uniref:Uncharacterized protein n=1 Tax=Diphasiastrum complanatum TaxID=34168 RepID=A0ACC2D3D1_DIPCM|nr:hypothetical protein O6H91_07G012000 [Diphasiastrum complanatum]